MSADIVSLNEKRACEANDGRLWTVEDALRAVLRDLESGAMRPIHGIYIAMIRKEDDQTNSFPFITAGLSRLELRGLLAQHLHDLCEECG